MVGGGGCNSKENGIKERGGGIVFHRVGKEIGPQ